MKSIGPFLSIGCIAALTHQLVVIVLVEATVVVPSFANPLGFGVAWLLSYVGHRKFTFRSNLSHWQAAPRFFCVSLFSLFCNQVIFVLLLTFTPLHYTISLFITLAAVSVLTYLLSAKWAFYSKEVEQK